MKKLLLSLLLGRLASWVNLVPRAFPLKNGGARLELSVMQTDTREKRSAHACLPCFRREFASASPNRNYTRYQNKLDSGREIKKSKLHTQKMSLEFHEHKVY